MVRNATLWQCDTLLPQQGTCSYHVVSPFELCGFARPCHMPCCIMLNDF